MKESKFKVGDKVITINVDKYSIPEEFEGKEAIIEHIIEDEYCIRYIFDKCHKWYLPSKCLKNIEEPIRYNPLNLKFGEGYWCKGWVHNPSILIGSSSLGSYYSFAAIRGNGEEYTFTTNVDLLEKCMQNEFMLYSDYLKRERMKKTLKYPDLVVGRKYNFEITGGFMGSKYPPYEFVKYDTSIEEHPSYFFKDREEFLFSFRDPYIGKITEHVESFKYPDLVVGKKYNLECGNYGPYEFMGYTKDRYIFKNNDGNVGNSWNDDDENAWYAGKITEHVEPEVKPESKLNYPNLVKGKLYTLAPPFGCGAAFNPFTFVGYTPSGYRFKDCEGETVIWQNCQTGIIQEYQEPYSKEFYVVYDPNKEGNDWGIDSATGVWTNEVVYSSKEEAKNGLDGIYTKIKKFRITEVPIDARE